MKLATIGYEKDTQANVIDRLRKAGVEVLIDVRAVAASRRAGFSKTLLAASLEEAGIDYVHLRDLGTPPAGRLAARAGRTEEMRDIFRGHLAEPAAQIALAKAAEIAGRRKTALLCYEADHCVCHRAIVADRICEALDACEVEPL
ncbi:DUF488 family protein [Phenylobacterium sp. J367]|uniref:DUF488 domain-containing protein n=1 Tax=Phenylobacterium sp. J367 TaxID=2898435 RepID=UPI002151670E|nr:DUF488 domain-containing protein [Phenylobacterium sp. J367]MCR5878261.1 DUF488 domain-containing protein [Phenylobacterium sp. J367]